MLLSYKLGRSKAGGFAKTLIREDMIGLATSRFGARKRPTTVVSGVPAVGSDSRLRTQGPRVRVQLRHQLARNSCEVRESGSEVLV